MTDLDKTLARIDTVLRQNRQIEWTYIVLTVLLFLVGIGCIVTAIVSGQLIWSTPSAVTTGLLYSPLKEIKNIRRKNIALATAPALITMLPTESAATEIQKLLETLYQDD